jgi:hypothetical protein
MKNEASKTRSLNIAFVVTPDLLKRLAVILGETSYNLEYTAKFSDGTSVRYDKIEDVIGQPNSDERSILSLIAGTADESFKSAYVNLKKKDLPSLEYTINGTQRDVIYFADKLDDWIAAGRQWYSPFVFPQAGLFGPALLLLVLAAGWPIFVFKYSSLRPGLFGQGGAYEWVGVLAMFVVWIVEYFVFQLFPRVTFAIGQGERRHQFFIYVRRTVLFGTGLSVVVRLLWVWIARHP